MGWKYTCVVEIVDQSRDIIPYPTPGCQVEGYIEAIQSR
jgi:hypothetical protein